MRKLAFAVGAALLAGVATFAPASAPAAQAATTTSKVAIIVGATHSVTPTYRSYANEVYAEAVKYSSNVVKVYSPNATARKVKAAVDGASIVVYLGHGNGWPSPYTYDPNYTTKNGFGLNADTNNDGKLSDYENKYYGEPWIEDLTPAPNAVVLLFHLCYASGNSEPGDKAPSLSTAKQRVDNYAAAFIRAGARAVIADGHSHSPYYIWSLFNTRQTIDQLWRGAPSFHGNVMAYPSVRNPGYTFQMDPDKPTGGYYRSITGKMGLRTEDVTGAGYARTDVDPPALVVPGSASVRAGGAPIYGDPANAAGGLEPTGTLAADAKVRVDSRTTAVAPDGSPVFGVHALDGSVEGFMPGSSLVPRDSAGPRTWTLDDGTGAFSPNDDGVQDAYALSVRLSEGASWRLRIMSGDDKLYETTGTGDTASVTWSPAAGSVADGTYAWRLHAEDAWGNPPLDAEGSLVVDTRAPQLSVPAAAAASVPTFTPNGDGISDTIGFAVSTDEPGWILGSARDAAGNTASKVEVSVKAGDATLGWDGRSSSGGYVADGQYEMRIRAKDRAGNVSEAQSRPVAVYGSLKSAAVSKTLFFPQDGDGLAKGVTFSFTLKSAATVDWTVVDARGTVVRSVRAGAALAAGGHSFWWDGRNDAGAFVPRGIYRSVVRATNGSEGASQSVAVRADAFKVTASDSTPARGQTITVRATSAEGLSTTPIVRVYQPGRDGWKVRMTRVSAGVYKAKVTLRSGSTGTLRLRVIAADKGGRKQDTSLYLPLH